MSKKVYILVNCFYPPKHYYNVLPSRILWWKSIQNSGIIESYIKMRFYKKVHILVKNTFLTITWRFDRFLLDNEM